MTEEEFITQIGKTIPPVKPEMIPGLPALNAQRWDRYCVDAACYRATKAEPFQRHPIFYNK